MALRQSRGSGRLFEMFSNWLNQAPESDGMELKEQRYNVHELHQLLGIGMSFESWFAGVVRHFHLNEGRDFFNTPATPPENNTIQAVPSYTVPLSSLDSFARSASGPKSQAFTRALDEQLEKARLDVDRKLNQMFRPSSRPPETPLKQRLREHQRYLAHNFATDSFTVLVLLADDLRLSEQELVAHRFPSGWCRRADGPAGQAWHEYRKAKEWAGEAYRRPLLGKTIGKNPRVAVYSWQEHRFAVGFFRNLYLPERVPGWPT